MNRPPLDPKNPWSKFERIGRNERPQKSAGITGKLMLLLVGGGGGGALAVVAVFFAVAQHSTDHRSMDMSSSTPPYALFAAAFIVGAIGGILAILALLRAERRD